MQVPSRKDLEARLRGVIKDPYARRRELPELLELAGQELPLSELVTKIRRARGWTPGKTFFRNAESDANRFASPGLVACFISGEPEIVGAALRSLRNQPFEPTSHTAQFPQETLEELGRAIDSGGEEARRAYDRLEKLAPGAPASIPLLVKGLCTEFTDYCEDALRMYDVDALPDLAQKLRSDDKWVRRIAAGLLGELGPAAAPAVPHLLQALEKEEDAPTAGVIIGALEACGGDAVARQPDGLKIIEGWLSHELNREEASSTALSSCLGICESGAVTPLTASIYYPAIYTLIMCHPASSLKLA